MSYLNTLANDYAPATNYYSNVHTSLPNYFMLTIGQVIARDPQTGVYTRNGEVTDDNLVRELIAAGLSFAAEPYVYAGRIADHRLR